MFGSRMGLRDMQDAAGQTVCSNHSSLPDRHCISNRILIATPQIRNAPNSFRISADTRSNRNKIGGLKLG